MKQEIRPSLSWLLLAAIVFVVGAGGGTALLVTKIIDLPKGKTFIVPSTQTFNIDRPGTHTLWHDYRITFKGKVYNKPEELPDQATITLENEQTGEVIPMSESWHSTVTSGQHEKTEIGSYNIEQAGTYVLSVTGLDDEHVFSFGRSYLKGLIGAILACVVLSLLGVFGAIAIVIVVLVARSRNKRRMADRAIGM
ncbi:MAG: hypothetical protein HQ592_02905 [Planctomycetes bacterium]|nr:hypothetical protein [Planctomycetota bacterium]